ncbi:hypothetical protein Tco_0148016 [Tanacetum coccineum]
MSQPANDEFSQHLSDDEESNHEDASDTSVNGNSNKRISTGKDGVIRILPPVTATEIQAIEKERKAKNILLMAIPKEHIRRFHEMDDVIYYCSLVSGWLVLLAWVLVLLVVFAS